MSKRLWAVALGAGMLASCGGGGGGGGGGAGYQAQDPGSGDGTVRATAVVAGLVSPQMMTVRAGMLYVADRTVSASDERGTIRVIDPNLLTSTPLGVIYSPVSVAFSGTTLLATGKNPTSGRTGVIEINQATQALTDRFQATYPAGLTFDTAGYGYVADDLGAKVLPFTSGYNAVGSGVAVSSCPSGVAYDGGYVYVTRCGGGAAGVYRFASPSGAASAFATSSYFNQPTAIAVRTTPQLEFYVVNTGGTVDERSILKISADGSSVQPLLSAKTLAHGLCAPTGLAIEGNTLYFANSSCTGSANAVNAGKVMRVTLP